MTSCKPGSLGLCSTHGRGQGAHVVEADGLCDVGREEAGRQERAPSDLMALTVGMRIRGPMTALTALQALVGDALGILDNDRHPNRVPEVRRRLHAAHELCVRVRSEPRPRRARRA